MKKLSLISMLIVNCKLYIVNSTLLIVNYSLFIALLFSTGCKQTTEPGLEAELRLEAEDVSCTEAWIKLTTANLQLPATVNVYRNDIVGQTFSLSTRDTVLYIDSLLPRQTYRIKTTIQTANQSISSNELTVTTMDTTSHEFSWQSWEFGQHGNSVLFDVAIIDENDIWAVGAIYMNDSLGRPDPNAYNAVHWDGTKWELKRILYKGGFWTIRTIFGFSPNDIWFSGYVRYYNGQFIELPIPDILIGWGINKLWGSSSEDLYAVGNNGNIAHWDGRKWTKLVNYSDINLNDIKGYHNRIWTSGYSNDFLNSILFEIINNNLNVIWSNFSTSGKEPFGHNIYSIYPTENDLFISSNYGVFRKKLIYDNSVVKIFIPMIKVNQITGTGKNDIYTVGDWSSIWHYNGLTAKEIYRDNIKVSRLNSAGAKANLFVAVGEEQVNVVYYKAKVIVSRRIN